MVSKEFNDYKSLIKKNKLDTQKNRNVKQTNISIDTIAFCLENEYYGIEITYVKEIIKEKRFTRLPKSLPYVKGLINLRGSIIPVVDLKKMFNLPSSSDDKILKILVILKIDDLIIGMLVDQIVGVISVNLDDIEPPSPLLGFINEKYIDGVIELPKYVAVLLNIREIFSVTQKDLPKSSLLSKEETFYRDINKIEELAQIFIHSANIGAIKELYIKYKSTKEQNIVDSQLSHLILQKFLSHHTNEIWKKPYLDNFADLVKFNLRKYPFGKIRVMVFGNKEGYEFYSIYMLLADNFPNADILMTGYVPDNQALYSCQNFTLTEKEFSSWSGDKDRYFVASGKNRFILQDDIAKKIKFDIYNNIENNIEIFDIIVVRDLSIYMIEDEYKKVIQKIVDKNLPNEGIFIIGDNEEIIEGLNLTSTYDNKINGFTKK